MKRGKLKVCVGWAVIISNAAVLFFEFVCLGSGWMDFSQFTTVFAITTPMFACYVRPVLSYFGKGKLQQSEEDKKDENTNFVMISLVIPLLYGLGVLGALFSQVSGHGVFDNFEEFKRGLMYVEIAFSIYAGQTLKMLFSPIESE